MLGIYECLGTRSVELLLQVMECFGFKSLKMVLTAPVFNLHLHHFTLGHYVSSAIRKRKKLKREKEKSLKEKKKV